MVLRLNGSNTTHKAVKQTLGNIGAKRDGTKRLIVAGGGSLPGRSKDQEVMIHVGDHDQDQE